MITIYHNPRCAKSREGLAILESQAVAFIVKLYLKEGLKTYEIRELLKALNLKAQDVIRKNEKIWKQEYKNASLTEDQIIEAISRHPILLERPLVVRDKQAVIGRPPEKINTLFD